ncbi:hypothetical protein F4776DRAFT_662736 [Hypoxylon sp. NC0597]|nr:hypothetical protein F4776DRAFT_662736 [Hypoxylon sp. NC0597]
MQFATVALALFGTALAAPANQARQVVREDENITEFGVHKTADGTVDGVSFHLLSGAAGSNIVCSATASQVHGLPTDFYDCGDASYHFQVLAGADASTFTLRLQHDIDGLSGGIFGHVDIHTYCHAGGLNTQACTQTQTTVTAHLDNRPSKN